MCIRLGVTGVRGTTLCRVGLVFHVVQAMDGDVSGYGCP